MLGKCFTSNRNKFLVCFCFVLYTWPLSYVGKQKEACHG